MTSPINSSNNAGKLVSPADLAAKINGPQAVGDAAAQLSDFSRWMARHTQASPQGLASAAKGTGADKQAPTTSKPSENMDLRHAAARAQANAMEANRKAQVPNTPHAPKVEKAEKADKPDTPKAASTEAAKPPQAKVKDRSSASAKSNASDERGSRADSSDSKDKTDVGAASAAIELATVSMQPDALVSESPAASDPASMLAWLASLTQGDPAVKKVIGLDASSKAQGDEQKNGALSMAALLGTPAVGTEAMGTPLSLSQDKGAAAIDVSLLQAAQGRLALLEEPKIGMAAEPGADFATALSAEMMRGPAVGGSVQGASAQTSETLATPVDSPEFPQVLADRVGMWVKSTGEGDTFSAELHLNPAEMGPISIKISMDGQTAQVDFAAAAIETRRAIEESLQLLSDSLDEAGLKLGGSGVSDQSDSRPFGQAAEQNNGQPAWMAAGQGLGDESGITETGGRRAAGTTRDGRAGGLDLYA